MGALGNNWGGGAGGVAAGTAIGGPIGSVAGGMYGQNQAGNGGMSNPFSAGSHHGGIFGPLLGTAGGFQGTGVPTPTLAPVQMPIGNSDVGNAQAGVGNSLEAQQNLLRALQGQGGMEMQNTAGRNQYDLMAQLQGRLPQTGGVGNLQNVYGQMQGIANGTGPNPAQAMLNQQTGQNVANQSAMMAGQRGAGSNVGMLARQAGQQGVGIQQQAVGQGATMQANQQLGALGQMGGIAAQQLAAQQAANQAYANQANLISGQQVGQTNANTAAQQANQQQMLSGIGAQNQANVSAQGNVNTANAALANAALGNKSAVQGGMFNSAGAMMGMFGAAHGGEVHKMAQGGDLTAPMMAPSNFNGPQSSFGQFLQQQSQPEYRDDSSGLLNMNPLPYQGVLQSSGKPKGGKKPSTGSGQVMAGSDASEMDPNKMYASHGGMAQHGGSVTANNPAQKAVAQGDSYANDKVKAVLSEGEVVIPRSIMQSADPVNEAAKFIAGILAKKGK